MSSPRKQNHDRMPDINLDSVRLLTEAQWQFGPTHELTVFELHLRLATPAVFSIGKADIPLPGLPHLDGFLSFLAFQAALRNVLQSRPDLIRAMLWQWNRALQESDLFIQFKLPLRETTVGNVRIYDCSIGLPFVRGKVLIPAGSFFVHGGFDLVTYPDIVDSLPLRRRVVAPMGKRLALKTSLNVSSGKNKALDNRMYYALTEEYLFYFRGDVDGVKRLLNFAINHKIGIGKKTSLGYGQIADFNLSPAPSSITATLAQSAPVLGSGQRVLTKTLPYHPLLSHREGGTENIYLFGCERFRLGNALETIGAYSPPFWQRETQTHILMYGTSIISVTRVT